jgi:hypothetical protein
MLKMNELSKYLTEQILLEEPTELTNFVVVYSGRFQPFHKGHYATYQNLVKKFGRDRVYIGTSNKTDNQKSPFNFKEKKIIMTKMFGIPSNKIVEIKNPYAPIEILKKYDENTTGYITVVGEKDASRLGGKYFEKYTGKIEQGYKDKGYVYVSPAQSNPISGTDVRKWLGSGEPEEQKKLFIKVYPKFDEKIFKLITLKLSKLNENMPGGVGIGLSFPNGTINGAPKPEDVKKMRKKLDAEDEDLTEEIKLDVNIGDTVLMGKFKNKKTVVKSIGKDEHGMPTINGKKVATFRILPKVNIFKETNLVEEIANEYSHLLDLLEASTEDEKYVHLGYGKYKEKGKEKDQNAPTFEKDDSGKYTPIKSNNNTPTKPKGAEIKGAEMFKHDPNVKQPTKQPKKDWTVGKDGWEILDDDRAKVDKIRDYSDNEYEEETGEYFENEVTQNVAPNAFKDEQDMIQKMKAAKPVFLSSEEMQNMGNTDVGDILAASEDGGKEAMLKLGKERAAEYGKDWDRLEKGIASNSEVPAPMALRDKNGDLHLLAGNTRIMSFTASGKKLPVKVIDYDGEFNYDETKPANEIKKDLQYYTKLASIETHESRIPQNFNTAASDYHSIAPIKDRKYDKANFNTKTSGQPDVEDEDGEEIDEVGIGTGQSGIRPEYPKNDKLSDRMKVVSKARTHTDSDEDYQYDPIAEMAQSDLDAIEKYADSQLSPEDIELGKETDHFFQRLTDPRNGKPISPAELTGFFKRLARNKKKFIEFVKQYKEFVVKDSKSNINIAFMKAANKLIAKTIMRKPDFKTTSPIFKTEVKEAFTKGQIFAGKMKVGGKPVNVEVELVGADNKTKEFITRIIYADKGYERQLPIGSTLPIPARIFRTPGGGWRRIKTPSVFESINESAVDIVNIFIMIAQMTFVGASIKTALDAKGIGPIDAIKKWWNEIKTDRAIKSISNKIKTDPDIIEFLKLSPSQQRGKFRTLVASKLSGDELAYLNKINKSNLS